MNMAFQMKLSNKAYNVLVGNEPVDDMYNEKFENNRNIINTLLRNEMKNEYALDGTALQKWAFSQKNYDIFLSHSHKDIDKVKRLANWLEQEFGLKVFVDSLVWMNCDDLLKGIDDLYCKEDDSHYSYEKRNYSTSHVHMMLATALAEVMDRSRCVLFFNTTNSISIKNAGEITGSQDEHEKQINSSPWLYYEINMIKFLKPKPGVRMYNSALERRNLHIDYDVSELMNEIYPLKEEVILEWQKSWHEKQGSLPIPV